MPRGRPPKPKPGSAPLKVRKGAPTCPAYLNAAAKAKWKELVRDLKSADILAKVDADTMARYCVVFASWQKANDMIQKSSEILKGPNGGMVQNPWLAIRKAASAELHKISVQLGMDPLSRQRLQAPGAQAAAGVGMRDRSKGPPPPSGKPA